MSPISLPTIQSLKAYRRSLSPLLSIGFVPTMGALHEGHIALVNEAKKQCDIVICSIFVNPTQFDKQEDLDKYPRAINADLKLLENAQVDAVFFPQADEVYAANYFLKFDFGELEKVMEGKHRNGHFNGVATIVSKLFHWVSPHKAFFGQKDLQQVAIIKDLVKALNFEIEIVSCPIIRDENGLALSSRNSRLSLTEKNKALNLSRSLEIAFNSLISGNDSMTSKTQAINFFKNEMGYEPEYLEIVYSDTLTDYFDHATQQELAVCIAAQVGQVRLIDNKVFKL